MCLQLCNSPTLSSTWTWQRVLLPSVQELWLGCSVWPREMPVDDTVFVVLSWCDQRAWGALLNQKWEEPQNLCGCTVQGQLPLRTSHMNHQGASVVLQGLRTLLGGEDFWKTCRGNVPQALAWEKQICLCKAIRSLLPHPSPFVPHAFLTTLSFPSAPGLILSFAHCPILLLLHRKSAARSVCRRSLPVLLHRAKADV